MGFCHGLILPILPLFASLTFDASYSMVGLVLGAQGLGNLVSDLPVGVLIRRLGRKRVMLCGAVVISLSAAAVGLAQSLHELVLYRFVSGIGGALWNISRHAYLTEAIRIERRGRASAMMGGMGRITSFAGPFLGGVLATAFGFRVPFLVYAVLAVIGLIAVARWVTPDPDNTDDATGRPDIGKVSLMGVLRSHSTQLITAGSGQLCAQMIRASRNIIIPLYAVDVLGLDAVAVGLITSLSYGIDMLMFVPAGMIMDHFGRKFAYVPSFILQSAAMACIPLTSGFAGLLAAAMLIGLGNGIGSGTMLTLGSDLAPTEGRGEFLGLWRFIGDGGHAAGPLLLGRLADVMGLGSVPLVAAGLGLAGAGILGFLVPETLKRQ